MSGNFLSCSKGVKDPLATRHMDFVEKETIDLDSKDHELSLNFSGSRHSSGSSENPDRDDFT